MASFLDTNVLVYFVDDSVPEKQAIAKEVVRREVSGGTSMLSTQVLQEFYTNAVRKMPEPLGSETAEEAVREFVSTSEVIQVDVAIISAAIARTRTMSISFWDALIVEAALWGGAERLLTEDLQHGREIDGLTVENPFT